MMITSITINNAIFLVHLTIITIITGSVIATRTTHPAFPHPLHIIDIILIAVAVEVPPAEKVLGIFIAAEVHAKAAHLHGGGADVLVQPVHHTVPPHQLPSTIEGPAIVRLAIIEAICLHSFCLHALGCSWCCCCARC